MGNIMKRLLIMSTMLGSLLMTTGVLAAENTESTADNHSTELDKYYLRIGAFIPLAYKNQIRADTNYLLSATIDTESTLGQGNPDVTPRIEGYWRWRPKHTFGFVYWKLKQEGSKTIEEDITWDEEITFLSGDTSSFFEQETFKLDYTYSFYRSSKVELGLSAGLHITRYDFGISGQANVFDENGNLIGSAQARTENLEVTAPLPVVGFKLNYNFTPKTRLMYKTDLFALRFDKYKGNLIDSSIVVEYQAWKHVGFGGGVNSITIQGESEEDNGSIGFYNRALGAQLYLTLHY
jgi:hypothetical protein